MVLCDKQAYFFAKCLFKLSPPSPPDWKDHKSLNVTPSGSGEKQGREQASPGCCLCFSVCPELGDGDSKPANSCLEIENS